MAPRGADAPRPRRARARLWFLVGVVLMAASFLVYPAYPVLFLWPASSQHRLEVTIGAAAASWGVFGIGLFLAGRRGWVWLRRRWKGRGPRPGPPGPVMPAS
jgi:hypothetical protein